MVRVFNLLKSVRPTGMAEAGNGLLEVVPGATEAPWSRDAQALNDAPIPAAARTVLRFLLAQASPLSGSGSDLLIYSSHHAPIWSTGAHVVVIHDLISLHSPFQHRAQTLYFLLLLPRILRAAKQVVFISESVRKQVAEHLGAWILDKSTVIPSFSPRLTPIPPEPVEREQDLYLFVGARYRHKNLGVVLEAFQRLNDEKPHRLKVLGFAREVWSDILDRLFPKGLPDWLMVEDYCSGGDLQRLYRQATALIYPSLAEGQGLPPLEAMAAGMPVICSDIPVLRETCGEGALFFQPHSASELAEAVSRLEAMRREGRLASLTSAGRDQLEGFSRESIRTRWQRLLEPLKNRSKAEDL